jgi:ABC-type glycerol-3-phosphate transport system substrate-binding protein
MMEKLKLLKLFYLAAAVALTFSGCAVPKKDAKTEDRAASTESGEFITLRIIDWSQNVKKWRDPWHERYQELTNPNVKIDYTAMTQDQFKNMLVSLISSGDAPDLFPVPVGMTLPLAVSEGWFQPLNPYVTKEWIDSFEDVALAEGKARIGDNIYCPAQQFQLPYTMLFYNKDILAETGVAVPATFSEFISACKTITEKGAGKYYGYIDGAKQVTRLDAVTRAFNQVAGGKIAPMTYVLTRDGRAPYDTPEMFEVFEMFARLTKDGSIHPDTLTTTDLEARELFGQGQAAFNINGPFCIPVWKRTNANLNVGVAPLPVPDGKRRGMQQAQSQGGFLGIYAKSKHPKEAAEYLMYFHSEDFEKTMLAEGGKISVLKGNNEKYLKDPLMLEFYRLLKTETIASPDAIVRSSDVNKFYAEVKDVNPGIGPLMQGVMSGSLADYKSALKTLADRSTIEWKRACEAVGLDYNVFEFPNWDPLKPYTDADYDGLPKLK